MKTIFSSLIFFSFLWLTSCGSVSVSSDFDRNADFSQYKTFAYHQEGLEKLEMNSLDKKRVVTAIGKNLAAKGFTPVQDANAADLIVSISAANKNRVVVDRWYDPWFFYGPFWQNPMQTRNYREGTLVIDLVDAKQNTLVWQGIGTGINLDRLEEKSVVVPKAVDEILAKFPPKK
ncbi:DUF4136 domain-containing protein [Candidatus Ornithobacterium hominis]|uniref:DUF4136 domain-containing protein n=1 Tax=Candidatus Ornithobacterium hominis TaxID=2497989 RepID=UPI0024BCFE13|nr:DUF4136 domain-containing protein [Candidatus Ornithobacterium hominis]CAI9428701.1 DUF4136 domain-containing protein [Candidatus Ornithobacterium hominis]